MRVRIRSKWRNQDRPVSVEENAVALAAAIWRIALEAAKELHAQDFAYESDEQRLGVIVEYLVFLIHASERLIFDNLSVAERHRFMSSLARECGRHLQQNASEIMGRDDYLCRLIDTLNIRAEEYSETVFTREGPGYDMCRCFGHHVQEIMGHSQANRWVTDLIIEVSAPESAAILRQTVQNLLGSATAGATNRETA